MFVDQKWPDRIFPIANFVFSRDGHLGGSGGGGGGGRQGYQERGGGSGTQNSVHQK